MLAVLRGTPRRSAGQGLCALLLLALVGACAGPATSAPPPATAPAISQPAASPASAQPATTAPAAAHVTVAYPAPVITMAGFYIAMQQGYTREEGLEAEMVLMSGTLSAQGIMARQVDFGLSAGALLSARLRGAPIKNLFVQIDKPLYTLFGQPDVHSMADLVGKPVGINAMGDSTHLALAAALSAAGVSPEQVTLIVNIGSNRALAALQAGSVAAAVTNPPVDIAAERLGYRNLGFLGDYIDNLTAGLAAHEEMIRERPEIVRAAVRAELKAHRYMQENREGSVAHMARFQEVGLEDAARAYDQHIKHLTKDGLSTPERLERIVRDQRQELGIEQPVAIEDAFDLSFARQAAQELAREGWRP